MQDNKLLLQTLRMRYMSSIAILVIFLIGIIYSKIYFTVTMVVVLTCMIGEWFVVTRDNNLYLFAGLLTFSISVFFIIASRWLSGDIFLLLSYFFIIWAVDSMALIGGTLVKGVKLAPTISPNKTISGFFIGIISGGVIALIISRLPGYNIEILSKLGIQSNIGIFLFGLLVGVLAQISDLLMSYFKRKFYIKDYSNMIPGHGGMIDRFDSIILTSPLIFYLVI